jgi:hypothetical protein
LTDFYNAMNIRHAFIAPDTTLFRILDGVADATNILLFLWLLAALVMGTRNRTIGGKAWLASVLSIAAVYIIKTIDGKLDIWESLSADYSTHSALAAALVVSLCFLAPTRRVIALGVFAAYELLIVILGFHSVLDIVTTLVVVVPLMILGWKLLHRTEPQNEISSTPI